ncbi:MAG: adenosylcobinamide amidohydrolase [Methanoregula sp.]|nr:adenosylcobinamide amidohydrolase [Methanoregula sp.]
MRHYTDSHTFFIRGPFRAASTGISGGIRTVSTIFNHTIPAGWNPAEPGKELSMIAAAAGLAPAFFGLLTAVPVQQCCVLQYDFVTVFITAGIHNEPLESAGTINIIVTSSEGMVDAALLETIMVATEAKADALAALGLPLSGTPTDAVIAACENAITHTCAGRITEVGRRVRAAVLHGIPHAIQRHDSEVQDHQPSFFVFSRIKGEHWVEWTPYNCPYYPCHFAGQHCDFCYCPFYPCKDESLGQWSAGSNGNRVWNCAGCTLLHEPAIADYLIKFPLSSLSELRARQKKSE